MEPFTFEYETPGRLRAELRIPAGQIEVQAAETDRTRVTINGVRDRDDLSVELFPGPEGGHRLQIEPKDGRWLRPKARSLHVYLEVPRGTDLQADTGSADLDARGPMGSITFRTGSGSLAFEQTRGDLEVKTASGDVRGGDVGGDLSVHGASADVSLDRVGGSLVCRTASGDLSVEGLGGDAKVTGASGDIRIASASRGSLDLQTVSGDVEVGVPAGTAVWLDLSATSGATVSELEPADRPAADAALEIRARAVSGDVRVVRASSAA